MTTITVLLSTYNGEKFIREQIDSLLQQEDVELQILARDDGSSDTTLSILEEYSNKFANFNYYHNVNLGPAKSFLDLIKNAPDTEYYALCDQDDYWDKDKLKIAISRLKELDNNKPNLYYSNLRIVDENLTFYRFSHDSEFFNPNKYSALTENLCTGCTAVFNKTAQELLKNNIPNFCTMHDTWIYILCKFLGNTVYDSEPHISYRQHSGNVVGAYLKKSKYALYKERLFRIFKKGLQPRYMNAKSFYECFGTLLDEEDKRRVLKVVNYKNSIKDRASLFFDKDISASSFYGNLRFRLHVLWGTV